MKRTIKEHLYPLLLLAAAFLWGSTFVAQSIGSDHVGAFTFLAGRSLIAIVFLFPLNIVMDKERSSGLFFFRKEVLIAGLCCGIAVAFASAFQQFGVAYTTTAKAGFITSMYVVLVPVLSVFLGKRPSAGVWFCVAVSVVGMYLLCMKEGPFTGGWSGPDQCVVLYTSYNGLRSLCKKNKRGDAVLHAVLFSCGICDSAYVSI